MALGVGVGAQAGQVPALLSWDGRGQVSVEPSLALSWDGEEDGRFAHWPRACGSLRRNSPFHSFLGVCGAISAEWSKWMLHYGRQSVNRPQGGL